MTNSRSLPVETKADAKDVTIHQDGQGGVTAFTFGDPEPVLDRSGIAGFLESAPAGRWYHPPVSQDGLAKVFDMPGPHASCIRLKVNLLAKFFRPNRMLSRGTFRRWVLDFLSLGNGYLEMRRNLVGRPLRLDHILGRYARKGVEEGQYYFLPSWRQEHEFAPGSVFHLVQEHPSQEIYGVPEFYGALQAGLLDEAATLFRAKYYKNGSHAGFILYNSEETITEASSDAIRDALRSAKGPGNFRNLYIHAPGGDADGIKVIPISEVAARDEFFNVKRVSRNEMLAAHRVPPQLISIIPENNGGFGDASKAYTIFMANEIEPLMSRLEELNDWLGVTAVAFDNWRDFPIEPPAG